MSTWPSLFSFRLQPFRFPAFPGWFSCYILEFKMDDKRPQPSWLESSNFTSMQMEPNILSSQSQPNITPFQMVWLLERLSSEDKAEFSKMQKNCVQTVGLTRGVPLGLCSVALLEWRRRVKKQPLTFGHRVFFYPAVMGVASFVGTAMFFNRSGCSKRLSEYANALYYKYDQESRAKGETTAPTSYAKLREANRAGQLPPTAEREHSVKQPNSPAGLQEREQFIRRLEAGQESFGPRQRETSTQQETLSEPTTDPFAAIFSPSGIKD